MGNGRKGFMSRWGCIIVGVRKNVGIAAPARFMPPAHKDRESLHLNMKTNAGTGSARLWQTDMQREWLSMDQNESLQQQEELRSEAEHEAERRGRGALVLEAKTQSVPSGNGRTMAAGWLAPSMLARHRCARAVGSSGREKEESRAQQNSEPPFYLTTSTINGITSPTKRPAQWKQTATSLCLYAAIHHEAV
ncbi:hypothetical protein EYF80_032835 [Liparis tanakae]|uniref:Uncharacterized protein n=1 Tax=Liparis tanakae TaxID=230148 RepID=A0A4Z2GTL4_9TELE|nr:hypothetical protein EYF80_032835 [Liparis tanakae]